MDREITALKAQKRNRERVNIYLDGNYAFGLSRIVAAWLHVGQKLSEEKVCSLMADENQEKAYLQAINLLRTRERSEAEIRQKLEKRGVPPGNIEKVLERLRRAGLVDDVRFAHSWVENRIEFRPRSRRFLAYELTRKGIPEEILQEAVQKADDEALAYQAGLKQSHKLIDLEWPKFRQRLYAFLARRGFDYSTVAPIIERLWEEQNPDREKTDTYYKEVNI